MTRSPPSVERISFATVLVLATVAFIWLLLPFYGALMWAVILAIIFHPLQKWLENKLNGRKGWAAGLSVLACICIVLIPGTFILSSLASEATGFYRSISSREIDPAALMQRIRDALPDSVFHYLEQSNLGTFQEIQQRITGFLGSASQMIATRLVSIGQGTAQIVISVGVMLYVLFFLFKDGPPLRATIKDASPLNDHHTTFIIDKFTSVVKATVKGNVIIALIQGAIGGITLWLLDIPAALLWGVLMAVLSLLPAVGSFIVWGPVALFLLLSGSYLKGTILVLVGVLVIGLVDNLLRPPLVGKETRMPDYVILVSTLGGISLIGINGFVVGPLIAAMFISVWSLLTHDRKRHRAALRDPAIQQETLILPPDARE